MTLVLNRSLVNLVPMADQMTPGTMFTSEVGHQEPENKIPEVDKDPQNDHGPGTTSNVHIGAGFA